MESEIRVSKETHKTDTARKIFAVLWFFLLSFFINAVIVRYMVLNPQYWMDWIFSEDTISEMAEDFLSDECFDDLDGESKELLTEEVFSIMLDTIDDDETEPDMEWFSDFYDEHIKDTPSASGMTEEEFIEFINDSFEDYRNDIHEGEFLVAFNYAQSIIEISAWVSFGVVILLFVLTLKDHRNKYVPVNSLGLSLFWAGLTDLGIWGLIKTLAGSVNTTSDEHVEEEIMESVNNSITAVLLILVAVIIVSIAVCVISTKAIRLNDEDLDDPDIEDRYSGRESDYE